jgi:hypothetical protein
VKSLDYVEISESHWDQWYLVPLVVLAHSTGTDPKIWYIKGVVREALRPPR